MSTAAAPKLHKYRDVAPELAKTRPPPGHDHVSRTIIILRPVPLPVLMNLLTTGGGGRDAAALYPCFSFYIINYIRLGMGGRGGGLSSTSPISSLPTAHSVVLYVVPSDATFPKLV